MAKEIIDAFNTRRYNTPVEQYNEIASWVMSDSILDDYPLLRAAFVVKLASSSDELSNTGNHGVSRFDMDYVSRAACGVKNLNWSSVGSEELAYFCYRTSQAEEYLDHTLLCDLVAKKVEIIPFLFKRDVFQELAGPSQYFLLTAVYSMRKFHHLSSNIDIDKLHSDNALVAFGRIPCATQKTLGEQALRKVFQNLGDDYDKVAQSEIGMAALVAYARIRSDGESRLPALLAIFGKFGNDYDQVAQAELGVDALIALHMCIVKMLHPQFRLHCLE